MGCAICAHGVKTSAASSKAQRSCLPWDAQLSAECIAVCVQVSDMLVVAQQTREAVIPISLVAS